MFINSDFGELLVSFASLVDRNVGYKILNHLATVAKVLTVVDFTNLRIELEELIIRLNSISCKTRTPIMFVLNELNILVNLFTNNEF